VAKYTSYNLPNRDNAVAKWTGYNLPNRDNAVVDKLHGCSFLETIIYLFSMWFNNEQTITD
jgi:hypothetical protein